MRVGKLLFNVFFYCLLYSGSAFAQYDTTHIRAVQENVPMPDSGGRWTPFSVGFTNLTKDTLHFQIFSFDAIAARRWTDWQLADASHSLADNFTVDWTPDPPYERDTLFEFTLLPGGKATELHLQFLFMRIAEQDIPRPVAYWIKYTWTIGDTAFTGLATCQGYAACTGPWLPFDGRLISNKKNPADPSQIGSQGFYDTTGQAKDFVITKTTAKYSITGEYSDRFIPPPDTTYSYGDQNVFIPFFFKGAPKAMVRDTLHCTYTNCWGTDVINAPIEAYSAYSYGGYTMKQAAAPLVAPFLGRTEGAIQVINHLDVPITIKNLAAIHNDTENFSVISQGIIDAKDSGNIRIIFKDNNVLKDLLYQNRNTLLVGNVFTASPELPIPDSAFSLQLSGAIDVYSPNYFSSIPQIKHGIHPAGIIFRTDRKSFVTFFGNNDPVSEYFYPPYYEDSHFNISLSGINLPGNVLPDTGALAPNDFEATTTFSGDDYHNILTKLHWPRGNDTVTMDVLAVGSHAPPFNAVTPLLADHSPKLWPNPASTVLHFDIDKAVTAWIFDPLGRILRKIDLPAGSSSLDVSNMPSGLYEVSVPSQGQSLKLEIIR